MTKSQFQINDSSSKSKKIAFGHLNFGFDLTFGFEILDLRAFL